MGNACCSRVTSSTQVSDPVAASGGGGAHAPGRDVASKQEDTPENTTNDCIHQSYTLLGRHEDSALSLMEAQAKTPAVARPWALKRQLSSRGDVGLDILLHTPKTPGPEREAVFEAVTKKIRASGYAVLIKLEVEAKEPLAKLGALQYVRAGLSAGFRAVQSFRVIKMDDERVFAICHDASHAVQAGLIAIHFCGAFRARHPDALPIGVSVGLSHGEMMVLTNDFYGDPVNVASKLGEDNASPGDLSATSHVCDRLGETEHGRRLLAQLDLDRKHVLISGVEIPYALVALREGVNPAAAVPGFAVPSDADIHHHVGTEHVTPPAPAPLSSR